MASPAGERLPGAGQAEPELEHAGQVQPDHEEEPGHRRDRERRLELEAPTRRAARRAEREQGRGHGGEGGEHAGDIEPRLDPHAAALRAGEPGEAHGLDREHRKDAGHQIEDEAAQEGEAEDAPERRGQPGRCAAGRGADLEVVGRAARPGDGEHPRERGILAEIAAGLQGERHPVRPRCEWLGRGVVERAGGFREERGVAGAGQGMAGNGERAIRSDARVKLALAREVPVRRGEERGLRGRSGGAPRQVERELAVLRDADLRADEPVRLRPDRQRAAVRRRRDRHREEHLARIGVGHQRAFGQALRRGEFDRSGPGALRQGKRELRRRAGRARIFPVGVPAGGETQTERGAQLGAGLPGIGLGDERGRRVPARHGRALQRPGRREREQAEQQKEKPAQHGAHHTAAARRAKRNLASPPLRC